MAFRKIASCLILFVAISTAAEFPVKYKTRPGTLKVDETGISYAGAKATSFSWKYQDIQRLTVSPNRITVLTYQDNRYLLGADRNYDFTGEIPAKELYALLSPLLDQRFVAAVAQPPGDILFAIAAKHVRRITGTEGTISFGSGFIVYDTPTKDDSRTWRYQDIQSISSASPFELTVTTFEQSYNFQLKSPLPESRYNVLWLEIEKKNRGLQ